MPLARGTQLVFAIAQKPYGAQQLFCTLLPICFLTGEPADSAEFDSRGLVFWRKSSGDTAELSNTGSLVIAQIEVADQPGVKDAYRTISGSCRNPSANQLVEVINASDLHISEPADLLTCDIYTSHNPNGAVLIRTNLGVFGPLKAAGVLVDAASNAYKVSLLPPPGPIAHFDLDIFGSFSDAHAIQATATISLRNVPAGWSSESIPADYCFLLADALEALKSVPRRSFALRSAEQVLRPLIRRFGEAATFRPVDRYLEQFLRNVLNSRGELSIDEIDVINSVRSAAANDAKVTRDLAEAIVSSGFINERLEDRISSRVRQYVEERATELEAQAELSVRDEKALLEQLRAEREVIQDDLMRRRTEEEASLRIRREEHEMQLAKDRAELEQLKGSLAEQQNVVRDHLEEVSTRFETGRQQVLNDFMAIWPLLQKTNTLSSDSPQERHRPEPMKTDPSIQNIIFPGYANSSSSLPDHIPMDEADFFEAFVNHTRSRGFRYRRIDLLSYHQSIKMSDFIVLGGPSGTGKSSLPRLYAEAMNGSDSAEVARLKRIAVSPSWLDIADFLGRVNTLEHSFSPSESGAYRFLLFASAEYRNSADRSGLHSLVLDEMNLAQVEHYFGPFLQVLGTTDQDRRVDVFDPNTVSPESTFADFASLPIPPNIRFIGTVNFDETTRPLSLRVLDRGPLIRIESEAVHELSNKAVKSSLGGVTLRHLREWSNSTRKLSADTLQFMDKLRQPLRGLGCPLSPRTETAISQFLTTTSPQLITEDEALDLALSQRIVPKIRGLFRASSRKHFSQLSSEISNFKTDLPETERLLEELEEGDLGIGGE